VRTPTSDSKKWFSNRVADTIRYRPAYPPGVLDLLRDHCGLTPESAIADVGSGTGILTRLFLEKWKLRRRRRAERGDAQGGRGTPGRISDIRQRAAAPEATGLPDATVDFAHEQRMDCDAFRGGSSRMRPQPGSRSTNRCWRNCGGSSTRMYPHAQNGRVRFHYHAQVV
jgi:hypothetical protein